MTSKLHLWEGFGVELEYMLVDATSLDVRPQADGVLHAVAGQYVAEVELGELCWSNELALHVIELKTNGPVHSWVGLADRFQEHVQRINQLLAPGGARLMPTAMHPWMDPDRELRLWPHEYSPVYAAYDRIFDCRGHGWANLQSVHLNLPFSGDEEFGRLHAAIRLLLPVLPALAASSPVMDGRLSGLTDNRLDVYRTNSIRVPSVSGQVIPEPVFTQAAYEREIFQTMYRDIAPLDPAGTLQHEWLNARGAIARFDRDTIEIRLLDIQECPAADVSICQAIVCVLEALVDQRWTPFQQQQQLSVAALDRVLRATTAQAERAKIDDLDYLRQLGWRQGPLTAGGLWQFWRQELADRWPRSLALDTILRQGPLARRITQAVGHQPDRAKLHDVYGQLCDCLASGQPFLATE